MTYTEKIEHITIINYAKISDIEKWLQNNEI